MPNSQDEEGETEEGEGSYRSRTYRLERTYGVSSGKWYYECEVLTEGSFKVGWQTVDTLPDHEVGGADTSWAFDGHLEAKEHMGIMEAYGKRWHVGDIVGVFLDLVDRTISERVIHRVGNLATLQDAHIFHRVARFLSLYGFIQDRLNLIEISILVLSHQVFL